MAARRATLIAHMFCPSLRPANSNSDADAAATSTSTSTSSALGEHRQEPLVDFAELELDEQQRRLSEVLCSRGPAAATLARLFEHVRVQKMIESSLMELEDSHTLHSQPQSDHDDTSTFGNRDGEHMEVPFVSVDSLAAMLDGDDDDDDPAAASVLDHTPFGEWDASLALGISSAHDLNTCATTTTSTDESGTPPVAGATAAAAAIDASQTSESLDSQPRTRHKNVFEEELTEEEQRIIEQRVREQQLKVCARARVRECASARHSFRALMRYTIIGERSFKSTRSVSSASSSRRFATYIHI